LHVLLSIRPASGIWRKAWCLSPPKNCIFQVDFKLTPSSSDSHTVAIQLPSMGASVLGLNSARESGPNRASRGFKKQMVPLAAVLLFDPELPRTYHVTSVLQMPSRRPPGRLCSTACAVNGHESLDAMARRDLQDSTADVEWLLALLALDFLRSRE
jgi:hypothetical protein